MDDETIICRCEEVTLGQLKRVLAAGVTAPYGLRLFARAGMGACQGRICRRLVEALAEAAAELQAGASAAEAQAGAGAAAAQAGATARPVAYRQPVRPTLLAEMARGDEEGVQPCG